MARVLKLMTDYHCFPLWELRDHVHGDLVANVNPDDLPLTRELKCALRAWAASYDSTLNQDYPPDSGFATSAEEDAFEAEGRRLWQELQAQLGPEFKVYYFCNRQSKLMEPSPSNSPNQPLQQTGGA